MGVAQGMTMVFGVIAILALTFYVWLCSKWGKRWLDSLD